MAGRFDAPVDALRTDGGVVRLRSVDDADAAALHELVDRVSDRSIYLRFFSIDRRAAHRFVASVLATPRAARRAIVALVAHEIVGLAGYAPLTDTSAEIAVLIDDQHHHLGIGTLLIEDLITLARGDGLTQFIAEVLSENHSVLSVMRDLGHRVDMRRMGAETDLVCHLSLDTHADEAITARQRAATVASLRPVLAPKSVAVIGATDRQRSVGLSVLHSLIVGGFRGPVYPINPKRTTVLGRVCHPSVSSLPEPPELAVIAVPAEAVLGAVHDCGRAGVRGVVLLSSGFRESGGAGAALEAEVVALAREYDMRVIGPNCLGVVNTDDTVRLAATLTPLGEVPGSVGVASQSGALGIAVAADLSRRSIGVSQFVSLGNKADVSGNDLLDWWTADPQTKVVGLYLESFGNPRRFRRVARGLTHRKPVIAIKAGRSGTGRLPGLSHTAAAASPDDAADALCEQSGVVRVRSLSHFVDGLRLLATQPLPSGPRVAVVGNFGGPRVLAVDTAQQEGLLTPPLSTATADSLAAAVPRAQTTGNPIDLGAGMTAFDFAAALAILLRCDDVDALCVVVCLTGAITAVEVADALRDAPRSAKPVAVAVLGAQPALDSPGVAPLYDYPEAAMTALSTAWRAARMRAQPTCDPVLPDGIQLGAAHQVIARAAADDWLSAPDCGDLLRAYGVSMGRDAAVAAPVTGSPELLVGAVRLPAFGPAVVLGVGGETTDLVADRCLRLAPLTATDAATMTDRLRCAAIFDGYAGAEPVSRHAVHDLLARVSTLVCDFPQIAELELNPVQCDGAAVTVVDAKIRVTVPEPWPLERALRPAGHPPVAS